MNKRKDPLNHLTLTQSQQVEVFKGHPSQLDGLLGDVLRAPGIVARVQTQGTVLPTVHAWNSHVISHKKEHKGKNTYGPRGCEIM